MLVNEDVKYIKYKIERISKVLKTLNEDTVHTDLNGFGALNGGHLTSNCNETMRCLNRGTANMPVWLKGCQFQLPSSHRSTNAGY